MTLELGSEGKGVGVELLDNAGETLAKGTANEDGTVSVDYGKVAGDVVSVKVNNKEFDLSKASCTVEDAVANSNDDSSTSTDTSGSSSSSTTTTSANGDGSTEGNTGADSSSTTPASPSTSASKTTSTSPDETTDPAAEDETTSPAAGVADSQVLAAADPTTASDTATPTSDAQTPAGVDVSSLADGLKGGGIKSLLDLLDKATGGTLATQTVAGINDIVKLLGGWDAVKDLVTSVAGPYAMPINSVIGLLQALGLEDITSDGSTSATTSTPDGTGSVADDLNDIVDAEKALDLQTTKTGFSYNSLAGSKINCDVAGIADTSEASDNSEASDGQSSSSTDSTANGAKVDTGGSIETTEVQPSIWDRFISLF